MLNVNPKAEVKMKIDIEEDELQVWIRPKKETKESEFPAINEELAAGLANDGKNIAMHIYMIDSQIEIYRNGLRLLQPHGSGRMDVRYWGGKIPGRHPTPFIWEGLARGRKRPLKKGEKRSKNLSLLQRHSNKYEYNAKKIPKKGLLLRLKRTGKFKEALEQVKVIAKEIETLLTMRATIIEAHRRFKISTTLSMQKQNLVMQRMETETDRSFPLWEKFGEARYTELAERKRDHIILLDAEDKRLAKKGYQFGTMPKKQPRS